MSIDIFVQRNAGAHRGDDIVDPLIGSIPVAIQRGRNELDDRASGTQVVEVEAVYRTGLRLGQLGQFFDVQTGDTWFGKISGISHHWNGQELTTTLQIKKPTDFYLN